MSTHLDGNRKSGNGTRWNPAQRRGNVYDEGDLLKVRKRVFPRGSNWPKIIIGACSVLVILLIVYVVFLVSSVGRVKTMASTAMDSAGQFMDAAKRGNADDVLEAAHGVSNAAHDVRTELDSPVWSITSAIPFVGSDITGVRTLADALVDLSDNAIMPMAHNNSILKMGDLIEDKTVNPDVLSDLLVAVQEIAPVLNRSAESLRELPPAHLGPVADVMGPACDKIITADDVVTRVRYLMPYIPYLLGQGGETRHYLVLAQNPAEVHAIGGFVGTFGTLTVTDGRIEMSEFQDLMEALSKIDDAAGATAEEIECFGLRADTHHGDHNIIPDFSRVGQLYLNIWDYYQGFEVDGVIGLDPVFLQYLLGAVGSIETSKGVVVDSTNAAAVMLNQCLFWWHPKECDVFYRDVADEAMYRLLGNLEGADFGKLGEAILQGAKEGRCLVWIRDAGAEEAVKKAGFAGELKHDATQPQLGVYVSDASTSKMSYYLSVETQVGNPRSNPDGSKTYDVKVMFTNNFNPSAYSTEIPSYVTVEVNGRSEYDLFEEVSLIAPQDGRIEDVRSQRINTREGTPGDTPWSEHSYQGLQVWASTCRLDAQETSVITFKVVTSPEATEDLTVRSTPVIPPDIAYWNQDISSQVKK